MAKRNDSGLPDPTPLAPAIARQDHRPAGVRLAVRSLTGCGRNPRSGRANGSSASPMVRRRKRGASTSVSRSSRTSPATTSDERA
jgi:hypothetical protein